MLRYFARRLLYAVPILLGVSLFTFVLFYATVDPVQMAKRNLSAKNPTQEQVHDWLAAHGYDKPLPVQFRKHVSELFLLRFGKTDSTNEPIWDRIRAGVGPSTLIASQVFIGSLLASVCFALWIVYLRGTYLDTYATFVCVLLMSVTYLVYIMGGQFVLGKLLRYYPVAGFQEGVGVWKFVMLPTLVGILSGLGANVRLYRTVLLEEVHRDYVRTARAKGVSESGILFRHILKNGSVPILTSVVLQFSFLLMGSLLLESFFGIPGLGTMTVDAINSQDFAVVRAMVFLGTLLYIVGSILTDVSYALVDPRIRLE